MMKTLKKLTAWLVDPSINFMERIFVVFTIISDIGVMIALIGDIVNHESIAEIAVLSATVIFVPVTTVLCVKRNKIHTATRVIVIGLVVVILPTVFIFGGGVEGGGVLWIIFSYLYIGLVLTGAWRVVLLIVLTLLSAAGYLIEYFYPELIFQHSRKMFYIDSFTSIVMVGVVCYVMVWFQNRLYQAENRRAKAETEKAEELNRAQSRFFSSMSHEIRTPINSILGLNEIILRQEDASDEIVRDAANIQGAGKMLLSLINDILDFSKIQAGSMDIVPVEYRVGDMLSEIVNMIWLRAKEKGLKFEVDVDPQVPTVLFGDEVRIKQILINLLNNAVKYTKSGSVSLHIESEGVGENCVLLKISVTDTGMGIKQEAIPYLFDAFRRVDQEKNRSIEGTGLGLSIVKQLLDLMGGTITVNSVYTQGSTFTVNVEQAIADARPIGDISIIGGAGGVARRKHERRFSAPEARVLIVDDNEMNLEVEKKLLGDTDLTVDTALSGAEALEKTLRSRYDVILMDHLMPEMDGIECFERLREQTGGLNRNVPVVVLTANAGSENRELYNAAGFDGYLVKPVSGAQLEDMLLKRLPEEKVIRMGSESMTAEELNTAKGYSRKIPVLITTSSMSDFPDSVIRHLGLDIIPFVIQTNEGTFRDGVEIGADEVTRYISAGKGVAVSSPPEVSDYVEFFGTMLKKAQHVIHISLTTSMSKEYERATQAAKSFENVTVINSGGLSSAVGLLVLTAYKLARQNHSPAQIAQELEGVKSHIHCSFAVQTIKYMAKRGFVSRNVHGMVKTLDLHPCISIRNDRAVLAGMWAGSMRRCYERYIFSTLNRFINPDLGVLFVTYVDIPEDELAWIEECIRRRANFERIIFQQASAAVSVNFGPGTLGLLFMDRGGKNYDLGTLVPTEKEIEDNGSDMQERAAAEDVRDPAQDSAQDGAAEPEGEDAWLADVPDISYGEALGNCGGADSFRKALELFYRSIDAKADEIERYWRGGDVKNYTVKVHALKSSARLIGALELSEQAKELEAAGNAGDTARIDALTPGLLEAFRAFSEKLGHLSGEAADDRPPIDAEKLAEAYAAIAECTGMMDYDMVELALESVKEYSLPTEDRKRMYDIRAALTELDWERVAELCRAAKND
ncbi:MAG: DegV family EDD domain-containing protein [Ruminococcaceae bacterium]|nr:DegV family EDD domain-containing protein [Oscillospiraceae bacterium]